MQAQPNDQATTERTPLVQTVVVTRRRQRYPHSTFRRFCTICLGCGLIVVLILFLLPIAIIPRHHGSVTSYLPWGRPFPSSWPESSGVSFEELQEIIQTTPSPKKVREWSKYYTSGAHLAGTNLSQAVWTKDKWEEYGVKSEVVAYDLYINYPLGHRLALLETDKTGSTKVAFECSLEEDVLAEDPTTGQADRIPTFHGYSASGNVTAPYVFVNYGTYPDFEDLLAAGVDLEGKIAIAKYGVGFRGLKVKRAQELGMVGVVLYSDPGDDDGVTEKNGFKPYPDGPARQPSSVQRGSTQFISTLPGDPTTPGYPSKPGCPRGDPHLSVPKIPSLPISYADAIPLLKALNGHGPNVSSFNKYWQGGGLDYKGVDYNIGPTPDSITLNLVNEQDYTITPIWDVIGVINGTIPDEVIVIGNHRDAWIVGGASDPNSASAAMVELIRTLGKALKRGWKPLRTIVFASWDGEEYGMLGSTEWVEEFIPWLSASGVAYLNLDEATKGTRFKAAASPILTELIQDITGLVQSPNQTVQGQTVRQTWNGRTNIMGSGSDFVSFQDYVGMPSLDLNFDRNPSDPVYHYHSNYDSFWWMDNLGDPSWEYHVVMTKILGLLAVQISDSPIIPFNTFDYVNGLDGYLDIVKKLAKQQSVSSRSFSFDRLDRAIQELREAAAELEAYKGSLREELSDHRPWWKWWQTIRLFFEIRKVNHKQKYFEREFLYEPGLDNRNWFKHVVFAPGRWTGYSGQPYPGLSESLEDRNFTSAKRWSKIIEERMYSAVHLLRS